MTFACNSQVDQSMRHARHDLWNATMEAIHSVIIIGTCSYIVDFLLSKFDATESLENRGTIATGACASLYALCFVCAVYHNIMRKEADARRSIVEVAESDIVEVIEVEEQIKDEEEKH